MVQMQSVEILLHYFTCIQSQKIEGKEKTE